MPVLARLIVADSAAERHLAKRAGPQVQLAELQPWIFFEFGGAGSEGHQSRAVLVQQVVSTVSQLVSSIPPALMNSLTGNLVDKGKHLAAAVWAKATIDMGAVETQ